VPPAEAVMMLKSLVADIVYRNLAIT